MRSLSSLAIGLGVVVALAGCAAGAAKAASRDVNVTATEFKLAADATTVIAGSATFTISNKGTIAHEFVILQSDLAADALPKDGDGKVAEGGSLVKVDEVEDIDPGTAKTLTVDLKPGKYVFICNVAGHYIGGMRGGFEVVTQ